MRTWKVTAWAVGAVSRSKPTVISLLANWPASASAASPLPASSSAPNSCVPSKVTPLEAYPGKGRATAGVRCHRFLKGEDALVLAWVGADPRAVDAGGSAVALPEPTDRRDGSGTPAPAAILGIG